MNKVSEEEYVAEPWVQGMLGSRGLEEMLKQWATTFDAVKEGGRENARWRRSRWVTYNSTVAGC